MRRNMWVVLVAAATLSACGGGGDYVASVGRHKLSAEWVAEVMHGANSQALVPTLQASTYLTDLWVDMSLFAEADAENKLTDSLTISEATWFPQLQFRVARFHDSLVNARVPVSEAEIDSAIKAMDMRNSQHILLRTMGKPAAEEAELKKRADSLLTVARGGADFGELAKENSEDGSAANKGWLGPAKRSTWVGEFGDALWKLQPGEISPVIKTQFGYHIIRRASKAEEDSTVRAAVRDSIVGPRSQGVADAYIKELSEARKIEIKLDAAKQIKDALNDLAGKRKSSAALATFTGGSVSVADFIRWFWIAMGSSQGGLEMKEQLLQAPDSQVVAFARQLATSVVLSKVVEEQKIFLLPDEWNTIKNNYLEQVDSLKSHLGLNAIPASVTGKARSDSAAAVVMKFFDDVQKGATGIWPLPGQLGYALRGSIENKVFPAGLQKAVDLATAKNAAAAKPGPDSTNPVIAPAPGGPPIGGIDTAGAGTKGSDQK